ncbi:MAG: STAS domain-containing protein [bacterium]|nr:STAS domain-containing protein [bacterium]
MANPQSTYIGVERPEQGVVVLAPNSDIDMSRSPELRSVLRQEMGGDTHKVVIDLDAVEYMDSSGLATLVEAMRNAGNSSAKLVICNMNPKVSAIFEIARLDSFFSIVDSRDEAISL